MWKEKGSWEQFRMKEAHLKAAVKLELYVLIRITVPYWLHLRVGLQPQSLVCRALLKLWEWDTGKRLPCAPMDLLPRAKVRMPWRFQLNQVEIVPKGTQCLLPQQSVTLGDAGCWIFGLFPARCWDFPWLGQCSKRRTALPGGHQETTSNSSIFVWRTKILSSPVGSLVSSAIQQIKTERFHFLETTEFLWCMNASFCSH